MAQPRYEARVRYRNELLLPTSLYPDVEVPDGVPYWQPFLVPIAHELLHVADEIDLVTAWLPSRATAARRIACRASMTTSSSEP